MTILIRKPWLCSKLLIFAPKYSGEYEHYGEPVALLHAGKVSQASPIIIIEFTRRPHLKGLRFAIRKDYAMRHEVGSNGAAPMFVIPMSHLQPWATPQELYEEAMAAFPE